MAAEKSKNAAYERLRKAIKEHSPARAYLFYGEESYLRQTYVQQLQELQLQQGQQERPQQRRACGQRYERPLPRLRFRQRRFPRQREPARESD